MKTETTRQELYELAWKTPLTKISDELEVSYHVLRNTCQEKNIPLPVSGHWTKVHLGREVIIPPLPDFDGETKINLVRLRTVKRVKIPSAKETESLPPLTQLTNPDPFVVESKNFLNSKECYERDGFMITRTGMLQVKVSKSQVSRAMIILDAFIKLIKKRGHQIKLRSDKSYVVIAGEEIAFSLREKTKREQDPKSSYSYTIAKPLGILVFKMWSYHDKEWQDGTVKLDHQLESIMLRMEEEARYLAVLHEQARKHHEECREKERQKQAIAERKKKELSDFKAMIEKSNDGMKQLY